MVFHCQCLSFLFEEENYYTAPSEFNKSGLSNSAEKTNNLRVFTIAELEEATNNFCHDLKIGEDAFGSVYKGMIKSLKHPLNDIQVTVNYGTLQGLHEWVTEVDDFGVPEHPNIVKLVGYCVDYGICDYRKRETRLLLVYEYMPNGSVKDHLSTMSETPLSWTMRLRVAQDVARALTYLHEEMEFQRIFKDFRSSNILLDEHWNAKISNFRLPRLDPRGRGVVHVSTMTDEMIGYTAPEHIRSLILTSKSNIWSYGVFLFELITGRPPLDRDRPENEQQLIEWVKSFLEPESVHLIVDPRLEGKYSLQSAQRLSTIANRCLSKHRKSRPKMSNILEMVNQLIEVQSQSTNPAKSLKRSLVERVVITLKKIFMCTTKV